MNRGRGGWLAAAAVGLGAVLLLPFRTGGAEAGHGAPPAPVVHDPRLELTLFASDPDIVTPIGIAVDDQDRVYVLESHTHTPPSGYPGPTGDRVKRFVDRDGDGAPEEVTVFAEGLDDGMNLAFSPGGDLFVVTSRAVWALHDRDRDGVSESRSKILGLAEPEQVYDHAGLLGITFSPDGWLYLSRGNTGGQAWRLEGTDGSSVGGYGDGGNIVRARPDGTGLQEVATGFWNPFDLTFDAGGRLLAVDNDPDSRGPNRLLHVIPGGDYGYRSLYGESGIHPYLAWNGELPGTLPYAAGVGEAPSGILDAGRAALPPDYEGDVLATIWEESKIARVRLAPRGASLTGEAEVLVEGGKDFRPVAFATDSRGTIYVTDWVVRAYPNHGRGRVWRLSARPGTEGMNARGVLSIPTPDRGLDSLREIYAARSPADFDRLSAALRSEDPFVRTAAMTALARPIFRPQVLQATRDADADVRLGALLALRRARHEGGEPVARRLLEDPDPRVRQMALVWIGSAGMTSLRNDLEKAIATRAVTPALFEVYLATVEQLTPEFVESYRSRAERYAKNLQRSLPPGFLLSFIEDATRPASLRAIALRYLEEEDVRPALLVRLAWTHGAPALRLEAIRSLAGVSDPEAAMALRGVATDRSAPAELRAEALLALARQPIDATPEALALLDDPEPAVRLEAARYLRTRSLADSAREAVARKHASLSPEGDAGALGEQLAFVLGLPTAGRPSTVQEWQQALARGGSPARGRRVFFSSQATCSQCHTVDRRGGGLGPDLSEVGRSKTRDQLVRSILRPSDEVTPEWQGWYVRTADGKTHHGRQIDVGGDGADLFVMSGRFVTLKEVREYGTVEKSLMPEGLESNLTVADLRDLIAFLRHDP